MSAADFVHHDDMRPLEPTAWMSRRDDALTQWQSATPVLPHLTREDLRASREELLAALDAERAANAVAWGLVDDLFDRLKGRHLPTTQKETTT